MLARLRQHFSLGLFSHYCSHLKAGDSISGDVPPTPTPPPPAGSTTELAGVCWNSRVSLETRLLSVPHGSEVDLNLHYSHFLCCVICLPHGADWKIWTISLECAVWRGGLRSCHIIWRVFSPAANKAENVFYGVFCAHYCCDFHPPVFSPHAGMDYSFNLEDNEGVCDLFDVQILNYWLLIIS